MFEQTRRHFMHQPAQQFVTVATKLYGICVYPKEGLRRKINNTELLMVLNPEVPWKADNFSTSWAITAFERSLLHKIREIFPVSAVQWKSAAHVFSVTNTNLHQLLLTWKKIILTQWGGTVLVRCSLGVGTCFVYLPSPLGYSSIHNGVPPGRQFCY
jgi:hypothetical protein